MFSIVLRIKINFLLIDDVYAHAPIFIHVFYMHAYVNVDGRDVTLESCGVIEYSFYVSDDQEHDTLFVHDCFVFIYE